MKLKKLKVDNDVSEDICKQTCIAAGYWYVTLPLLQVPVQPEPVVPPQAEIIEADLYKRSYFGPDVPTLELECWEEELSEAQLQAYKTADEEYKSIQNKLDEIVKDTGGEIVYNGDQFTAYQLLGKLVLLRY